MTSMDILEKIFGSAAKVKIMRLFLFNPTTFFDASDIRVRAKVKAPNVRSLMNTLEKIELVKKKNFIKEIKKGEKSTKKKTKGWVLNRHFEYIEQLQDFLIKLGPIKDDDMVERFKPVGNIKLLVVAGVFIQNQESRIDVMVVGDKLKQRLVKNVIEALEAEIGKELRYTSFSTADFKYRVTMRDKLVRDVLDFPHNVVIDKIQVK